MMPRHPRLTDIYGYLLIIYPIKYGAIVKKIANSDMQVLTEKGSRILSWPNHLALLPPMAVAY